MVIKPDIKRIYNTAGTYWIGTYYDTNKNNFFWKGSHEPVSDGKNWSLNPWIKKLPKMNKTALSRVFLEVTREFNMHWSFSMDHNKRRFICELVSS